MMKTKEEYEEETYRKRDEQHAVGCAAASTSDVLVTFGNSSKRISHLFGVPSLITAAVFVLVAPFSKDVGIGSRLRDVGERGRVERRSVGKSFVLRLSVQVDDIANRVASSSLMKASFSLPASPRPLSPSIASSSLSQHHLVLSIPAEVINIANNTTLVEDIPTLQTLKRKEQEKKSELQTNMEPKRPLTNFEKAIS
ncbi:hypothetical protein BLNAU_24565 [Blattamonas nauphoetae]|uniref:Uncharacterized protein n=1 Tax=Blattamonas nauphoetae TaxID=2049346 RepID=A0ABQ9WM40_9EUKA|nr:hypothetical protein BLNAU_24565 [Blattamonas nauphoetae]